MGAPPALDKTPSPSLPPLLPPCFLTLCHFCADWNEKRNLLAVIWCDATNPDTTNHRSWSPSLHTDLWPPASSVTSASGETLDSFLPRMLCSCSVVELLVTEQWFWSTDILLNLKNVYIWLLLAPKPNFLRVFWGIGVLNLLLLVISCSVGASRFRAEFPLWPIIPKNFKCQPWIEAYTSSHNRKCKCDAQVFRDIVWQVERLLISKPLHAKWQCVGYWCNPFY